MRILVTGGAGFIGSHVVDAYVQEKHRVWVIDNESSGNRQQVNKAARFTRLDIRDRKKLEAYFRTHHFDVLNHHAAQIDVRKSVADPQFDAHVNIMGSLNLLELARRTKVKKFIFSASGGTAYGECRKPANENSPEVPLSPYGISKLAVEKYIQAYGALHGLSYTIFRYGNVYGPRQDPHGEAGVVAIFSQCLLRGRAVSIFGNGRQTRDFVYAGDVARANVLALRRGGGEVVNIGTGKETSVNHLYELMSELAGSRGAANRKAARAGELQRSVLDIGKARRVLGWRPMMLLQEGLARTIRHFSVAAAAP